MLPHILFRRIGLSAPKFSGAKHNAHSNSAKTWQRLSFFVGFPAIGLGMLNVYMDKEDHDHRPEFIKYEYMYRREKRFPWGDGNHTFFHNPHKNALPDGYEV